jgi:hypothetical protein
MIVLWNNGLYELEGMPFVLFKSLQRSEPSRDVEIIELTQSTYKQQKKVPIKELEDWSEARNLQALGLN